MPSNREIVERYADALVGNTAEMYDLRHPDFVEMWPQSGERIRGRDAMRSIDEGLPNRPTEGGPVTIVGSEDRWVMTPAFTALRIEGSGDVYTLVLKAIYHPRRLWYVVSIVELRDEKIWRATTYFAEEFEAPESRSQWVERMTDAERDTGAPRRSS